MNYAHTDINGHIFDICTYNNYYFFLLSTRQI